MLKLNRRSFVAAMMLVASVAMSASEMGDFGAAGRHGDDAPQRLAAERVEPGGGHRRDLPPRSDEAGRSVIVGAGDPYDAHAERLEDRGFAPSAERFGRIPRASARQAVQVEAQFECTPESLAQLSPSVLMDTIQQQPTECVEVLWTYSDAVGSLYGRDNQLAALDRIQEVSPAYAGQGEQNLYNLLLFARIGYYHDYFRPSGVPFDPQELREDALAAAAAFAANPHFFDDDADHATVLYQWITLVDTANLVTAFYDEQNGWLSTMHQEPHRFDDSTQGLATYSVIYAFQRHTAALSGLMSVDLVDVLSAFSVDGTLTDEYEFIVNNSVWLLGRIREAAQALAAPALEGLTAAYYHHPRFSSPEIWSVLALTLSQDCVTLSDGAELCRETYDAEVRALVLPHEYGFDSGRMLARTSLDLPSMQPLYHGLKQVESQFRRITGHVAPVWGDEAPTLTLVVYGSRADYVNFAPLLDGVNTDNGGIYLEGIGTFVTYDRTPQESLYSMEELVRHEYAHYLIGRYLIEGVWGSAPIYAGGRMVWFDEGMAEFLAGSTAVEGVAARRRLVDLIQQDGASRMDPAQITTSTYASGFAFYRYAGMLFHYLYAHERPRLDTLLRLARQGDVEAFDGLVGELGGDAALAQSYAGHLDTLITQIDMLRNPQTDVSFLSRLDGTGVPAIRSELSSRLGPAYCFTSADTPERRFTCEGAFHATQAPASRGERQAFFEGKLDLQMTMLAEAGIASFEGMVCSMSDVGDHPRARVNYTCEGPLAPAEVQPGHPTGTDDQVLAESGFMQIIDVTANDVVDGPSSIVHVSRPRFGALRITAEHGLEYRPGRIFVGQDEFTYVVSDDAGGHTKAAVLVSVRPRRTMAHGLPVVEAEFRSTATGYAVICAPGGTDPSEFACTGSYSTQPWNQPDAPAAEAYFLGRVDLMLEQLRETSPYANFDAAQCALTAVDEIANAAAGQWHYIGRFECTGPLGDRRHRVAPGPARRPLRLQPGARFRATRVPPA